MTHFPNPVKLPATVKRKRSTRRKEIQKSSLKGILIRSAIIVAEVIGVALFDSSSLFMDAVASFFDVLGSLILLVFVWLAAQPPDEDHPFGHGRYEPLVGLQLGLILVAVGTWAFIQQAWQIHTIPEKKVMSPLAWIIPVAALILLEICYRFVMYTAKKQNSTALIAEAYHYRVDAVTSLFAAVALILGVFYPPMSLLLDHIGAFLIALLMIFLGLTSARKNMNQLMDRVPEPKFFFLVKNAAKKVEGVRETEKTRIMLYGPDAHVDIDIEVDPKLSVEKAHLISQNVRAEIQKAWPSVRDVTVHVEPYYPNDH